MSIVYVEFAVCTVQIPSGPTVPPRSLQADCAGAGEVPVQQASTPATRIAATRRMRIVGRPREPAPASAPAHYCQGTWGFHRAREERKRSSAREEQKRSRAREKQNKSA